ncbi:MAG TPA: hypothetical protein VJ600_11110 [Holophagaceae bacterium]|nr:hypothetical protein [Holophagaceae bacterium]
MEALYGEILSFVRALRAAGREEAAGDVLHSLTEGCGPRELLDHLRWSLAELPPDAELGPELAAGKATLLAELERCWRELPGGRG